MKDLQTIALGMVLVFVDAGPSGWDWVPDPLGWIIVLIGLAALKELLPGHRGTTITAWVCLAVSVLIYPPNSVATIDDSLGWLFTLPTIAFCILLLDGLLALTDEGLALRIRVLRDSFVVVGLLPLLVYLAGWDWLGIPALVFTVIANIALLLCLWDAGDEEPVLVESDEG